MRTRDAQVDTWKREPHNQECQHDSVQNAVFYWDNDDRFKPSTLLTVHNTHAWLLTDTSLGEDVSPRLVFCVKKMSYHN